MPTEGTDRQSFRYPADKWARFKGLAQPSASKVLQDFIDWYIREGRTPMPKRPPTEDES